MTVKLLQTWKALVALLLLSILLASHAMANELTASVDRTKVSIDDRITLTLRLDGAHSGSTPDLNELRRDFDIISNQSQRRLTIINGRQEAWLEWTLRLVPRQTGTLTIPALEVEGVRSQPITIEVSETRARPGSRGQDIFVETEVNKDSVFVQEQLLFTVRLFSRVNLDGAEMQPLDLQDAVMKAVDENSYITEIDNRDHLVLETTFAVFPQRSGELVIPPLVYDVAPSRARQDPWSRVYGGRERQRLRTDEVRVPVQPTASDFTGDIWLPADDIRLSEHWSSDPDNLIQGEPVTRRITLTAQGLTAAQLPAIPVGEVAGVNLYPDQPQTDEQVTSEGVKSTVTQTLALVPNQTGRLTLPEVNLAWWDTQAGEMRNATLPARQVRVTPPAGLAPPPGSSPQAAQDPTPITTELPISPRAEPGFTTLHWWLIVSSALLLLLLLFLSASYFRLRQQLNSLVEGHTQNQRQDRTREKTAWANLKRQTRDGSLSQVRDALLNWARSHWPDEPIHSLTAIAQRSERPGLQQQLQALDRSLFSDRESPELGRETLLQEVDALRVRRRKQQRETGDLPPLYRHRAH
ncbi:BatD family protein [Marinimicrobium sp. ABcell2]|uniref:BatD family protein n=1 Tax=Marinimicrobium sp. ABcell2 TaxID=3069751 RepID=UPI0027B2DEB5|nr:BatD family protein [Marinimicrobium sp. ABcell2]MDQ2075617.1 BatD family protein [Marinimicrobium sp. ABcell2]